MTALIAWPNFHLHDGTEVANQVAAPAASRIPNLHRADEIAPPRVRMDSGGVSREAGTGSAFRVRPPDSGAVVVQINSPEPSILARELNANLDFSGPDLA